MTQSPERVHNLFRVARIGLANRDDRKIVKSAFNWQIHVDYLGKHRLQQWQENTLRRFAKPRIFHRRLAHDGRRINWITAMRDARYVKGWVPVR